MSQEIITQEESITQNLVVQTVAREELDVQIVTAKRYPRDLTSFRNMVMTMALTDEETAASCFYVIPRDGKHIEGPSVRLAEFVASAWGHLRAGTRVAGESEDGKFIMCEGFVWDLQNNNQFTVRESRRIVNKYGKRFSDDMIQTTAKACAAIAFRNAMFKVVPMVFVKQVYIAAKKLAVGDAQSLAQRRVKMVEWLAKKEVPLERVLAKLNKKGLADIDLADLEFLVGVASAIKQGDIDPEEAFPPLQALDAPPSNVAELVKSKVKKDPQQSTPHATARDVREMPRTEGSALGGTENNDVLKSPPVEDDFMYPGREVGEEG